MSIKNNYIGIGRLTRDPELKVTSSGKHVVNFDIAVDDGTKDKPHTTYVPCEAWEGLADVISKHFSKGDQIIISGRLNVRKVEDRGENRTRISIAVESFEWGQKKRQEEHKQSFTADAVKDFDDVPW